jgi:exonuclease SbcD
MSRLTVLHTAELHLDAPFTGLGRTPPPIAAALRDASLAAWDALVEHALAHDVAALICAGGLCGGLEHGVRGQARLRDGLARLVAGGIAVAVALGPRDPHDGLAGGEWPAGVTVFPSGGGMLRLRDGAVTLYGASCPPDGSPDDAARQLQRGDGDGLHIGVLPAALNGAAGDATLRCGVDALLATRLDGWALGATRAPALVRPGAPWVAHASTPQGRSFAESGARGVSRIELDPGGLVGVTLEPLDRVRCVELEVEVGDAAELPARCAAALAQARETHAGRALVIAATLRGAARALRGLRPPDARAALLARLRRDAEALAPFAWWASLRAAPPAGLDASSDDLAGEVARQRAALAADPDRTARFLHERFAPLSGKWTAALEPREVEALLDEAAALASEALADAEAAP